MKKTTTQTKTDFFYLFDEVWNFFSGQHPEQTEKIEPGEASIRNILSYSRAAEFKQSENRQVFNNVLN